VARNLIHVLRVYFAGRLKEACCLGRDLFDYQIPRFGSDAEKARLEEERRRAKAEKERAAPEQAALLFEDDLREMKPPFPTGRELEETVAVMRVLEAAKMV
jgi:hypothetical protein